MVVSGRYRWYVRRVYELDYTTVVLASTYDREPHDRCYLPLFQTHSILSCPFSETRNSRMRVLQ